MHVWLVNPYGSLPSESWREYRTVLVARALVNAGHTVLWWVANFEHRSKEFRTTSFEVRDFDPGFRVALVPTTGYERHISLARIRFEQRFADTVGARAAAEAPPDLIILIEPALFTSRVILKLAEQLDVPLMLDVVDLWPELFLIALPKPLRFLGSLLFALLYARRAKLVRRSAGYVAVSRDYLALMQSIAPRIAAAVVYVGVDVVGVRQQMSDERVALPDIVKSRAKAPGDVWLVYAGTLGSNYDTETLLRAAAMLSSTPGITIFVAGDGPGRAMVEEAIAAHSLESCIFLGTLPAETVARLYSVCDAALSTYVGDSTVSMPVKAFDYFAAGLPIINSLGRDLGWLVHAREAGLQYEAENAASLADAIRSIAADAPRRLRMAENAARLGEEFDIRLQYRHFVDVAEQVAREYAGARTVGGP
jgi:glycosyltransferase involved in cell wall biosynthesis